MNQVLKASRMSLLALFALVAGCGGGGGTPDGDPASNPANAPAAGAPTPPAAQTPSAPPPAAQTPSPPPPPAPATPNSVDVSFKQGDYLEYRATASTSSVVQGSSGSSKQDAASFRLDFGAPVQVGGMTLFPVTISGRTKLLDTVEMAPRWHYLGSANGKVYGSVDGQKLETVYSPDGASSGFFFTRDPATPATITQQTFQGDYFSATAIATGSSKGSGGCQTIAGYEICSDDSAAASAYEYFEDGVGPVGYKFGRSSSSNAGGFYTAFSVGYQIELTNTSLAAPGLKLGKAPHDMATLLHPRQNALATVHDGKITVFGRSASGSGTSTEPSEIEVYDPKAAAWSVTGQSPFAMSDYAVTTIGDSSYFVGSGPLHVYDHASSAWSTPIATSPMLSLSDGKHSCTATSAIPRTVKLAIWTPADGQPRVVLIESEQFEAPGTLANGVHASCLPETDFFVDVYSPTAKAWTPLGTYAVEGTTPLDGAVIDGDRLVLASGANGLPLTIDMAKGSSSALGLPESPNGRVSSAASVSVGGVEQFIGGDIRDSKGAVQKYSRQIEAFDVNAKQWSLGTKLFLGREKSSAVVLGDQVFVIGGVISAGTLTDHVEAYAP